LTCIKRAGPPELSLVDAKELTMMWDGWGGGGYGYGMAWFGMLHLVWWLVLIAGAAAVVRWIFGSGGGTPRGHDRAVAILRERYARGEIDKGEFDERMRHLKG
jgi:putative membrane protein